MIGDVLTSSILFEALRKNYPDAELHYLIYPHTRPVIENNPVIDKVIEYDHTSNKSPVNFISFLQKLRKENYTVVIDVYSKISTGILSFLSTADMRIGYKKPYTHFFYSHVFNQNIQEKSSAGIAIEKRLQLLSPLKGNFSSEFKPQIYLTENEKLKAKKQLTNAGLLEGKPLFMISVLGSSIEKTYPPEYLAVLLDHIVEFTNGNLIFNYIPSQEEKALNIYRLCAPVTQKAIHLNILGESLREFMALTSYCTALIGNEGGAVNMAKALNIPTFAIFSPSVKKQNWSVYDDGISQVSVHLEDFMPEDFKQCSKKEIRKKTSFLYEKFKPQYIIPGLNKFLKRLK
ncbi:heptosyltransferase-2 [Salegentibacter salinarum]|nr:heptosyltransferase-2 [Salegentibacter salinarum]